MGVLDAAGITDPVLRRSYHCCRRLNAAHGRTFYLATLLLPAWKRPYVHALYGFARYADEIVDDLGSELSEADKASRLRDWGGRFLDALRDGTGQSHTDVVGNRDRDRDQVSAPAEPSHRDGAGRGEGDGETESRAATEAATTSAAPSAWSAGVGAGRGVDRGEPPVLPAVIDTVRRWQLDPAYFEAFLASMAMDLTVTSYATWEDLMVYIHGSAVVIGLQMVPILEPSSPAALGYAADLGAAFQLANFIRDVGDDLRRGRVYLPQASLELFGVTREHLAAGVVDGRVRRLLAFEVARARELFRSAEPGIRLLHPTSQDCIRTAFRLYGGILDEVEKADYRVLDTRVTVGPPRRLAVAGPAFLRATRARRATPSRASR